MNNDEENKKAGLAIFGMENFRFKKYDSLEPKNEYDKEKVEELAEAMTELLTINKRRSYLERLLEENEELQPFLWTSMDGRVQALHNISDAHFNNIINYCVSRNRTIRPSIRAEAVSRGIEIPESYTSEDEYPF